MDDKADAPEIIRDHDVLGEKALTSHEDAVRFGELTEEELAVQKKMLFKIDTLIMPLVVLVYLMNYIDRYVNVQTSLSSTVRCLTPVVQEQLRCRSSTGP